MMKKNDDLGKIFDELWQEIRKWKRKNKELRGWMKKEFERHERVMKQIHEAADYPIVGGGLVNYQPVW